jgi:membrane protease YdiL (CAAX protease family)
MTTAVEQPSGPRLGKDFQSTDLDLIIATAMALGLPFAAVWLLDLTGGALAGLALYYVVCCIAIVRWRKGTLDYHWPPRWPWVLFGVSLLVPLGIAAINAGALPNLGAPTLGIALTALIWAPLNAALEQLSWLYVLDSWRNRWRSGWLRWLGLGVGIVLMLALIGLIHALFWARFLPGTEPTAWTWASIPLNFALTATYVLLYYRSGSMWPTFFVHLLTDVQLVLLARYSILPYL